MNVWDPIGVQDEPNAADEYDGHLGDVQKLLGQWGIDERTVDCLYAIVVERMELKPDKAALSHTVKALRKISLSQGSR